jgi:ribonuclease HII
VICGVDEAGKGAVLGPMVIAAVECSALSELDALPLKDSKVLTRLARQRLNDEIIGRFRTHLVIVQPESIDEVVRKNGLNRYLAELHASAIAQFRPDLAIVDACDVIAERHGESVKRHLDFPCEILAEHRADKNHKIVSAAGIVAKVCRDRLIEELKEDYGKVGSGYPSDPATIGFLRTYIGTHKSPPPCARASWKTVINLLSHQTSILEF